MNGMNFLVGQKKSSIEMNSFIFEVTGDFDVSVLCCEVFFSARVFYCFQSKSEMGLFR